MSDPKKNQLGKISPKSKPLQKVQRIGDRVDYGCSTIDPIAGTVTYGDWFESEGDEQPTLTQAAATIEPDDSPAQVSDKVKDAINAGVKAAADHVVAKVKGLKMKPQQPIMVMENLNVRLTTDEKREAAKSSTELLGQVGNLEEELKAYQSARKSEIKVLKEKIKRSTDAHNTGLEYRSVQCEQRFDLEKSRTWFLYRGESYNERSMTPREEKEIRNPSMFGDPPDLPNKVDPSQLPSPKDLGGDALAKQAGEEPAKRGRGRPKKTTEDVLPNGQSTDADIASVMRSETSKKEKVDHTVCQ